MANFQETIRYHDVKEFPQERETKRLHAELKNSETRTRAIEKTNLTYKKIIDQFLKDARYYEPVMSALEDDWKEQTSLVKQTYDIGRPAIKNSKKLGIELQKLRKVTGKEDKEHFDELLEFKSILKENPKIVRGLVRRDVSSPFPRAKNIFSHQKMRKIISKISSPTEKTSLIVLKKFMFVFSLISAST